MNIEKLQEIKKKILRNPKQFQMDHWFNTKLDDGKTDAGGCGTAACIAGWWLVVERKTESLLRAEKIKQIEYPSYYHISSAAQAGLDLPNQSLFLLSCWPADFRISYNNAVSRKHFRKAAKIVGEVIDNYIATNGWRP